MANYPQSPAMSTGEVATFLQEMPIARLSTHNQDGTIHMAPVWFLCETGEIRIGTQAISRKARNIGGNNQVTVLIDTQEAPHKGVVVYGKAVLDYVQAAAKRVSVFAKYMSLERAEKMAHGLAEQFEPVIIRIQPEQIVSYDYSKM